MTVNEPIRRRKILTEKKSQMYLSLTMILYLVFYTILMLGVILYPSIVRFTRSALPIEEQFKASKEFLLLDQRVVPVIVVSMIVMAIHFLFITNRIFGPLYRLRKMLDSWRDGAWPKPFRGRAKDFHEEFFTSLNATSRKLGEDVIWSRERLLSALDAARKVPREGLTAEASAALGDLETKCREALDRLNGYVF